MNYGPPQPRIPEFGWPEQREVTALWGDTNTEPVVSVISHVYNQREYIDEALAGMLMQKTSFPFEIIIRDDASSDGTAEVIRRYAEMYPDIVCPVYEKENTYKKGIKPISVTFSMTRGRYIAFCEGDDRWLDEAKLQIQHDFLESDRAYGAVHGNYYNLIRGLRGWKASVAVKRPEQMIFREGNIYKSLLAVNAIQTCTFMCRRDLMSDFRGAGLDVDSYPIGDWPLYLYIAHESKIGFIEQPMSVYRKTPGSITNSGYPAAIARAFGAIRMIGDFCDYFGTDRETRQYAEAAQYRSVLWLALRSRDSGHFEEAWNWLKKHNPEYSAKARAKLLRLADKLAAVRVLILAASDLLEKARIILLYRRFPSRS